MNTTECPNCHKGNAVIENTIYNDDMFEEVSCPLCGYYDNKITSIIGMSHETTIPDDFVF